MVSIFLVVALASAAEYVCTERAPLTSTRPRPSVDGGTSLFIGGKLTPWEGKVVDVLSPVYGEDGTQAVIGSLSAMDGGAATTAARAAAAAWDLGQGPWPQSSLKDRAAALGAYLDELEATARDAIIETLMWEIAKSEKDAAKEFDRTVAFARTVIATALAAEAAPGRRREIGAGAQQRAAGRGFGSCLQSARRRARGRAQQRHRFGPSSNAPADHADIIKWRESNRASEKRARREKGTATSS